MKHCTKDGYLPINDSIDHINVYSRGATELGRLLSNFAPTPFKHPKYGSFKSLEGFWFWVASGKEFNVLKKLEGNAARTVGKKLPRIEEPKFKELIAEALYLKIIQNPKIAIMLTNSTLPLVHYYYYGSTENNPVVVEPSGNEWIIEELESIRTLLKESVQVTEEREKDNLEDEYPELTAEIDAILDAQTDEEIQNEISK